MKKPDLKRLENRLVLDFVKSLYYEGITHFASIGMLSELNKGFNPIDNLSFVTEVENQSILIELGRMYDEQRLYYQNLADTFGKDWLTEV